MTMHAHETKAQLTEGGRAREFILAGNARFTLVSERTGARYTFRVRAHQTDAGVHFVSLLNGADNEASYEFFGTIFRGEKFAHGKRARITADAPSARAFAWAIRYILCGALPPECQVWHEGRCGKCGRPLTVPESIATGLGPVCAESEAA